jgi:ribosomal protein S1
VQEPQHDDALTTGFVAVDDSDELEPFADVDPRLWLKGEVASVNSFGLMVSVSAPGTSTSCVGLVHVSQVGFAFIEDLGDMFEVGQEVDVRVIQGSRENDGRLSLSMKPLASSFSNFKSDVMLTGTVQRQAEFGVFVLVPLPGDESKGFEGLVTSSQVPGGGVTKFERGQQVEVRIIKVDEERNQIDLSMIDPQKQKKHAAAFQSLDPSTWLTGRVEGTSETTVFVQVPVPGSDDGSTFKGVIRKRDARGEDGTSINDEDLGSIFLQGDQVSFRVLKVACSAATLRPASLPSSLTGYQSGVGLFQYCAAPGEE